MNRSQRLKKRELKLKRIEIINKIELLKNKCDCYGGNESQYSCSNCKDIFELTESLNKSISKRSCTDDIDDGERVVKRLVMTLDEFYRYRDVDKKTDGEIAVIKSVSPSAITRFKQKHGITKKKTANKRIS